VEVEEAEARRRARRTASRGGGGGGGGHALSGRWGKKSERGRGSFGTKK